MKRKPLSVPTRRPSESPEATTPELLDQIRHETPAGWRDLSALKPHPNPSRTIDLKHLIDLARSIAALELIHPLVVDMDDTVIAGSHRYAALRLLVAAPEERLALLKLLCPGSSASQLKTLAPVAEALPVSPRTVDITRIPVRILPLRYADAPGDVWRVEVAENERRRDYSPKEVRALAERLREQGYRFATGKPKEGEQPALPVLTVLIGKSERTIRRILSGEDETRQDGRNAFDVDKAAAVATLQRFKARHAQQMSVDQRRVFDRALAMIDKLTETKSAAN